ncbi:phytanoyl-CoA hydroxylase-interacting protein-like isoform X1 [Haliotis rubra]|uniref:phytanoyl-CoA hydroxylase-interacting protein-like isoform X1 n=1 Tax=Haliotis rubra TaxID=36100 RepID=UPI001EE51902|nr:phytanoyl-CoA hydroxylase-interacting protein-like isoform X1 [Haliotis rubra]
MAEGRGADLENVQALLTKAEDHCRSSDTVSGLYRNATAKYFDQLENTTMMPSVKDNFGNPTCPINGKLEGVFFGVTLYKGDLPTISPYGDTRVVVPLERLFDDSARLYFADFYRWKSGNHYVILVLTRPDTEADLFCQEHLIKLNERTNVFLKKEGSTYKTLRQDKVWVYVFYTDEVDISGLDLTDNFGNIIKTLGQSNVSGGDSEGGIESEASSPDGVPELGKELSMLQLGKMNTDQSEK